MTSPYQSGFDGGYSATRQDTFGNVLDDDFQNARPQHTVGGAPTIGFAALADKWKRWDPAGVLDFAGVDTRLQMLLLRSSGDKQWCGVHQPLPVPSAAGESVECVIYARTMLATIGDTPIGDGIPDLGPIPFGLFLAGDLSGMPDTAPLTALGPQVFREGGISSGYVLVTDYIAYDGSGYTTGGAAEGPFPAATYYRVRLRQTRDTEGTFSAEVAFEFGAVGNDWFPLCQYAAQGNSDSPVYRSVGLGLRSYDHQSAAAYFDLFRVVPQAYGDTAPTLGGVNATGGV